VKNLELIHRIEGVAIGNRMIAAGLVCHVNSNPTAKQKKNFIDNEEEFYYFVRLPNEPEEILYPKPLIDKASPFFKNPASPRHVL